jgi:hypothetical protein
MGVNCIALFGRAALTMAGGFASAATPALCENFPFYLNELIRLIYR